MTETACSVCNTPLEQEPYRCAACEQPLCFDDRMAPADWCFHCAHAIRDAARAERAADRARVEDLRESIGPLAPLVGEIVSWFAATRSPEDFARVEAEQTALMAYRYLGNHQVAIAGLDELRRLASPTLLASLAADESPVVLLRGDEDSLLISYRALHWATAEASQTVLASEIVDISYYFEQDSHCVLILAGGGRVELPRSLIEDQARWSCLMRYIEHEILGRAPDAEPAFRTNARSTEADSMHIPCPRCRADLEFGSLDRSGRPKHAFRSNARNASSGVTVGHCPQCQGHWFELDHLRLLLLQVEHGLAAIPSAEAPEAEAADHPAAHCARCDRPMQEHSSSVSPIRFDRCDTCQAVWFDPGELAQFGDFFRAAAALATDFSEARQ